MKVHRHILLSLILLLFFAEAHAATAAKRLALVWSGPGACRPACLYDAARMAKKAGFSVKYVNPSLKDFSVFQKAKLWVQPGGVSATAIKSMSPALKQSIVDFVANGGGYVGFCAGAFSATVKVGQTKHDGLGIIPGETQLLDVKDTAQMMKISTLEYGKRWMLFVGGPFLKISDGELAAINGEVIAHYPDGSIAGIRGHFGKGKVAVVGFHPEADFFWKLYRRSIDRDGSDAFFAVNMIKYATSPQ